MAGENELKVKLVGDASGLDSSLAAAITAINELAAVFKRVAADISRSMQNASKGVNQFTNTVEDVEGATKIASKSISDLGRAPLADLKVLDEELKDLKKTLASGFKTSIDKIKIAPVGAAFAGVSAEFVKYTAQARAAEAATKALNSTTVNTGRSLGGIKPGAGEAGFALMNLGRIAQDLPFGFIGIQNNITPLFESFARLSSSAGGALPALKAFAGSFLGPAGILFAISAIPAIIQIASSGIANYTKKTQEAKNKSEEFAKTLQSVEDIIGDATAGTSGEVTKVQALAAAILDTNRSYKERKNLLEDLKDVNKAHFGNLTLEASSLKTLTSRVDEYTNALIANAVVKGFEEDITRVNKELRTQNNLLDSSKTKLEQARLAKEKFGSTTITSLTGEERLKEGAGAIEKNLKQAEKAFVEQRTVVENLSTNYAELRGGMEDAVVTAGKFKRLTTDTTEEGKKEDAQLKALKENLDGYRKQLEIIGELRKEGLLPKFKEQDATALELAIQETLRKIDAREVTLKLKPQADIDPVLSEFQTQKIEKEAGFRLSFLKIPLPVTLVFNTSENITRAQAAAQATAIAAGIKPITMPSLSLPTQIPLDAFKPVEDQLAASGKRAGEAWSQAAGAALSVTIGVTLVQGVLDTFIGLGEGLANVINGQGGLAGAAEGFIHMIGGIISKIGVEIIVASKAMAAVAAAVKVMLANPLTGAPASILAGIGLVAVGQLLKNIKFSVPQLAEGGITTGPTLATIGERNQEAIIPLNKWSDLFNPGGIDVEFIGSKVLGGDIYQSWRVHHRREARVN